MRLLVIAALLAGCSDPLDGSVPISGEPLQAVTYMRALWKSSNEVKLLVKDCDPRELELLVVGDYGIENLCKPYCAPDTPRSPECPLGNAAACLIGDVAVVHMNFDITTAVVHEAGHWFSRCAGYSYGVANGHSIAAIWASGGIVPMVLGEYAD